MKQFMVLQLDSEVDVDETVTLAFVSTNEQFEKVYDKTMSFFKTCDGELAPSQITYPASPLCSSVTATYAIYDSEKWYQLKSCNSMEDVKDVIESFEDNGDQIDLTSSFYSSINIARNGEIQFELLPDNAQDIALCYSDFFDM